MPPPEVSFVMGMRVAIATLLHRRFIQSFQLLLFIPINLMDELLN
jgi:hypothetical protein